MEVPMKYEKLSKSEQYAIYSGLRTKIRLAVTNFVDQKPLPTFTMIGDFAGPRETMTPEQRKESRKKFRLLPLDQQIERAERLHQKKLARMKAKLAAQAAQPAEQPAEQPVGSF